MNPLNNQTSLLISTTCLYSTGHWIGATVLLIVYIGVLYNVYNS